MRCFVLADPWDCVPPHTLDLGWNHDREKVEALVAAFTLAGFDEQEPALVGYPRDGRIQLLTGTHRCEAARRAGIKLPVTLWLRSDVEATWGTDLWPTVIKDIPVRDLRHLAVPGGKRVSQYGPATIEYRKEEET